ncbi:MAG TPA: HDOD domain-containing protein, partial [Holophagaceae bacterium]|nr:HDOD domain-containing protein [Holophagaceae bacterium]
TAEDLRKVISTDQALTSQILKISNSAMFGMMREIKTLSQAIMTLGFSTIKSVVIASSAKNLYQRGAVGLQERLLWEHALVTALASRALGKQLKFPRVEEAFIGGLMHDIGKSVMGVKFPERYGAIMRTVYNGQGDALELELETFGFDHTMVGEALLRSWNLAQSLEEAVRWHHHPFGATEGNQPIAAIIALGNQMALDRKIGIGAPESLAEATAEALTVLKLTPETLESHQAAIAEALEQDKSMISEF